MTSNPASAASGETRTHMEVKPVLKANGEVVNEAVEVTEYLNTPLSETIEGITAEYPDLTLAPYNVFLPVVSSSTASSGSPSAGASPNDTAYIGGATVTYLAWLYSWRTADTNYKVQAGAYTKLNKCGSNIWVKVTHMYRDSQGRTYTGLTNSNSVQWPLWCQQDTGDVYTSAGNQYYMFKPGTIHYPVSSHTATYGGKALDIRDKKWPERKIG